MKQIYSIVVVFVIIIIIIIIIADSGNILFLGRSQNCKKRLLLPSCLSMRPSLPQHGTTRLPPDGLAINLMFECFF
jgi:hypothetical protein